MRVHLRETWVKLSVELGDLEMTVRDVLSLSVGDTLHLDRVVGEALPLHVEGVPKYLALPGHQSGKHAVKMLQPIGGSNARKTGRGQFVMGGEDG
jgi:flagellar motor switch protein FliM